LIYKLLGARLERIYEFAGYAERLADIGCDHGLVPRRLLDEEKICSAILTDKAKGPLQKAISAMSEEKYKDRVDFRLSDGLDAINASETDCVLITGMGGELITSILNKDKNKTKSLGRLILSPNKNAEIVRKWLFDNEYFIINDSLVAENGHIYEIIHASLDEYCLQKNGKILQGFPYIVNDPVDLEISNIQRREGGELLTIFVLNKLKTLETIINSIEKNKGTTPVISEENPTHLTAEEALLHYEKIVKDRH
jgi:tRNA A22 N-methylase